MCNLFFKYFIKQKKNILFLIVIIIIGTVISSISKIENNKNKEEQIFSKERAIEIFKEENFKVNRDTLTNTQLRNLLAMTSAVYDEARNNGFDSVNEKIAYLKVQFIYQSGRNTAVKAFIEVAQLVELVDMIRDFKELDDLLRFCHYMEALIAYFKYYGGSDK